MINESANSKWATSSMMPGLSLMARSEQLGNCRDLLSLHRSDAVVIMPGPYNGAVSDKGRILAVCC